MAIALKGLNFKVDPQNLENLLEIMDTYGDSDHAFFGRNQNGEDITVSVFKDCICVATYQLNGWTRDNTYWRDGTCEETFKGRWK